MDTAATPGHAAGLAVPAAEASSRGAHVARRLQLGAALALVIVAGLAAGASREMSLDESFSLDTVRGSLAATLDRALYFEAQAPLYFVVLHWWQRLGAWLGADDALRWARLLSTACVAGAMVAVHGAGRLAARRASGPDPALLLALVPLCLWAASEARSYALTLLLVALVLRQWLRVWGDDEGGPAGAGALVTYVLLAAGAVLTFYYAGFVIAGLALAAPLRRARSAVAAHAVLGVVLLPMLPIVRRQGELHAPYVAESAPSALAAVLDALRSLAFGVFFALPDFLGNPGAVAALVVAMGALVLAWARPHPPWRALDGALLVAAAVPIVALVVVHATGASPVQGRHWMPALVVPVVLLAALLARAPRRVPAGLATLAIVALLGSAAVAYLRRCGGAGCQDRWADAAALVAEHERPGEPVLLFSAYAELPFRHSYRGINQLRGLPTDDPWRVAELDALFARPGHDDAARFAAVLDTLLAGRSSFWVIRWYSGADDRIVGSALDSALVGRGTVTMRRTFESGPLAAGLEVTRLSRPPSGAR